MKNKFQSKAVPRGTRTIWRYLSALFILFTFAIGQMWGQDVTLADINYTQWDGTAMPANSGLSNSNTYYASNGTSRVATLVGKGCKLDDSSNQPTATGVSGSYEHYLRFGSSGNYLNITASSDLVKNAGETSYGKVRFLVSSQKNKTTDELAEVKIGETSLGKIYAFTSTSTCDWVEFDIPATVSKNATITLTRTTNTLFVWGIQIKTFTSSSSPVSVTGITLAPSSATIKVGKTVTLVPTITPSDATDKAVTWAVTSGSSYASVTDAGVVTGLAAGTAVVTATAHDGSDVTQTATITVEDCPTSGTLFSMTVTDPDGTVYTDVTNAAPHLIGATYVGGKAYATSTSSSKRSPKITGDEFDFNVSSSSSVAVKVELDCPLAEGDMISFTSTHTKEFKIQKVAGTNLHQTSSLSLAIPSGSSLIDEDVFYVLCTNSACSFSEINIIRPIYRTITLEYADGVTPDGSLKVIDGEKAAKPADPTWAHHRFDGWYNGASPYDWTATVSGDLTLTAHWTQLYTVTYAKGDEGATGDAPTQADKAATETFKVAANTFELAGKVFDHWNDGTADYDPEDTYTVGTSNVTLTAIWRTPSTMYAITKGDHDHGDFTISPAEQEEGGTVTLEATPAEDYLFDAWEVVKTEDASATGITVDANGQFEMPAYAVTVNATFVADTRKKVLYVTKNNEETTKASDKLYEALKDIYNVKIVGATFDGEQSGYDLIVLHESIDGSNYGATAVAAAKTGNKPVLNTKSYFYNNANASDQRWNWGTPNAGQSVNGATLNSAYCNIADHPLFAGVTVTEGFVEITDIAAAKCMQPIGAFTTGKEGYTLATTPNAATPGGTGCAIHELTPAQRGATSGKYLMISVSSGKLGALNANGQKLFQNAAAYLVDGSASWDPISVPTTAEVTATPSENYTEGNTITLTASATGTTTSTTYTWYKGADWATASATTPVQAAATDGNVFTKTAALEDAGTYWCNISNGTSCDVQASVTITVSSASTPTHAIIYDNTKGADMTAYPTEYTEGVGVASFAALADIAGWHFVEWSPASIAADATTDQTITAVWAQVFEVTFDLQGHGAAIAAQNIVSGGKVTKPDDPIAIGWDFGGWFTDAVCTAGNEWDFDNDVVSAATPLFAKWTEFDGCALLVPATSGAAPAVGDAIVMQTGSKGGSMSVVGTPLSYNDPYGLGFDSNASAKAKVTLNNEIQENTVITLTLVANGESARGLHIYSGDGATKITSLGWGSTIAKYTEATFTYTVQSTDVALIGSNEFQLWRNNSVWLKKLAVTACGDPVVFHNLTSAITPDHDPAYATVTLDASSVREGYTTKATYSAIDAGYEFDEWQISGTGASIADASANPAVITMGTTDAVITLKLKVATPKHTVTFNKMGKGDDVPSQLVAEGALVSEPSVAEPEGWMLEGWYKESTLENKWDFASDVMSTSDIELFANWVTDTSIKLINKSTGAINTTNFATAVAAEADVDGEKGASFSSARTAVTSISALGEMVQYNATTNQTKIQLSMYNTSTNQKTIYLFKVAEGDDAADVTEITIDGSSRKTTEYITFNSDKNRSFYVTVSDTKVKILQVKVVDDGTTPMKQFGQAGYSLNLNKGRVFAKNDGSAYPFEGGAIKVSSDYKVLNNSSLATKSYIQFNNAVANTILKVTRSGGNYYVSQDPEDKGTAYNKDEEIVLPAAGTWYLGSTSTGSSASFTKVEFLAPKCAEPAFNALTNSDICSGDPYVALDGTATVADAGVPTYQWYREDDTEITGETNATYTPSADGKYYVIATNHLAGFSDNEKKSDLVTVTTHTGTAITTGLADQRGNVDDVVVLEVVASGKNLHYAWKESATIDGTYTDVAGAADAASLNVTITASMDKYYKVVVSSDCGADQESIAHVTQYVPVAQADVTGSIAWNWANAASVAQIKLTDTSAPKKNEGFVMANGAATIYNNANFESDKLYLEGEYIIRTEGGKLFQGQTIKFHTTVAGIVRVKFSHTGNGKPARELFVNGVGTGDSRTNTTAEWSRYVEVPAGDVSLTAFHVDPADGAGQQYIRVYEIEFLEKIDSRTGYAANELGTACYEYDAVVIGATAYMIAGINESGYIVFDEILSGELEAGKPYLFEADGGQIFFCKPIGVTAAPLANGEEITIKGMVGTFSGTALAQGADDLCYFSGRHLWRVNDFTVGVPIPEHRCYVNYDVLKAAGPASAPAAGRRRISMGVNGENQAQGFENILGGETPMKVMIDGTLYIIRGEKVFDATGRLVK